MRGIARCSQRRKPAPRVVANADLHFRQCAFGRHLSQRCEGSGNAVELCRATGALCSKQLGSAFVVGNQQLAHDSKRDVELAQQRDGRRSPRLTLVIEAVPGLSVDGRGRNQPELVVAAQLLDAEPHQPSKPPDGQQTGGHASIIKAPPGGESSRIYAGAVARERTGLSHRT